MSDSKTTLMKKQLSKLLPETNNLLFAHVSSYYSRKPWNENDLRDAYELLRDSNQAFHQNPLESISVTATGGELNTRTLYVTPVVAIILSIYKPTFLQGNKAISGCGCGRFAEADIMRKLGVRITNGSNALSVFQANNFAFLHALNFHPLLEKYHKPRAALGFRDIFKVASTLADPFLSPHLFLCIYSEEQLRYSASILANRNTKHSVLVTGLSGIDEASIKGKTLLVDLKGNHAEYKTFSFSEYGFSDISSMPELRSKETLTEECEVIINILRNKERGCKAQLCVLNAGIALYAADVAKSIKVGIELAKKTIETGVAYKKFLLLKIGDK